MKRLTEEKQLGPFAALKDKAEAVPGVFGTYDCFYAHAVAVTKLKQYEDTGLEPEEVTTQQPSCVFYCNRSCNLDGDFCAEGPGCPHELTPESAKRLLDINKPNDPLTLDQLRELDVEKIYIHYINGFYTDENGAYFGKFEQLVRECEGRLTACELPLEYYGKAWLAYCRRPEVTDHA